MSTLTYDEYLPLRGNKVKPADLMYDKKYYIEEDRSFLNKLPIVYEGEFGFNNQGKIYFNYLSYVVNPNNHSDAILPIFFYAVDIRLTIYEQKYNLKEINQDVDNMVSALTGKRRTIIGPLPRGQSRKMRHLPEDAATIMALNILDPDGVSQRAKNVKSKHNRKHSKGGKRSKRNKQSKRRSRKQSKH